MAEKNPMAVRLGNNIRALRTAYGETQEELQFALGLNSKSTVSQYETGKQLPLQEIRAKIASHYRITEDELLNGDVSARKLRPDFFVNEKILLKMLWEILPVACSEEALDDADFYRGYKAHLRAVDDLKAGRELNERNFDICADAYQRAFDAHGIPEAAANLFWWALFWWGCVCVPEGSESTRRDLRNGMGWREYLKRFCLPDSVSEEETKYAKQEYLHGMEELLLPLLSCMRRVPCRAPLAEYYTALRYSVGLVENSLSESLNRTVGLEMMRSLADQGNAYAKKYMTACCR